MTAGPDTYVPALAVGVTSSRIANVSAVARTVHRAILRAFATTGQAPDAAALADATPAGHDLGRLLAQLHDHDVIRVDEHGRIRAAYPFSGIRTPHTVAIDAGPSVYAMCAIDALGIADMLGRDTTITSTDPTCGQEITVTVRGGRANWKPQTVVVFVGSDTVAAAAGDVCCPPQADGVGAVAAAERCCGVMNFFVSPGTARDWVISHPEVSGIVLIQEQAFRLGVDIFGHLLDD
jgi:hypothetical protein